MITKKMKALVEGGSAIRAMFEEGKKMIAERGAENVFDFSLGNPSIVPPKSVKESIIDIVNTEPEMELHGYMNNSGYEDVREAIAEFTNKSYGTNFTKANIVMTVGAAGGINVTFKTLVDDGDEIICIAPYFGEYNSYISNANGVRVVVSPDTETFSINFKELEEKISPKTKFVIINSPNNPTGAVYSEEDIKKLADAQGKTVEEIKTIISSLHEFNPMMGHRGLRLAVTYPEIAKMQTKAVIRAAINVQKKHSDWTVKPEIMIPLSCDAKELKYVKDIVVATADAEIAAAGVELEYQVGTMIEIPRAALTADEIAKQADFFCFGTNDLTQMTYGFSRDDAGKFLDAYYDAKIFENDPFAKLDQVGVGKLMEMAIKLGKPVNPNLHVGICGEHGGDPSSVEFCHKIGLDYVSCSPFRVPIARLAAAQAAIANK